MAPKFRSVPRPQDLVCVYGDDLTGSVDAIAQFDRFGLSSVLLLKLPNRRALDRLRAENSVIGVAGMARSLTTEAIEAELLPVLTEFVRLDPTVIQYKMCSTFDSSAAIGSIGRVCEIASTLLGPHTMPVVAAQPELGRFTVFHNHFARAGDGQVYRLDRHPTMSTHPTTPMFEADLIEHLRSQTSSLPISGFDLQSLERPLAEARRIWMSLSQSRPGPVVFDALTDRHLVRIADVVWPSGSDPLFALGSGGLSYGLASHLRNLDSVFRRQQPMTVQPVDRILVVSGSCAPETWRQIQAATETGWAAFPYDIEDVDNASSASTVGQVAEMLFHGIGTIVYTCRPGVAVRQPVRRGLPVGVALAEVVRELARRVDIQRLVVVGGDTAGLVLRLLGAERLEVLGRVDTAVSLCRLRSSDPRFDGLEVIPKGGQVGGVDVFSRAKRGTMVSHVAKLNRGSVARIRVRGRPIKLES